MRGPFVGIGAVSGQVDVGNFITDSGEAYVTIDLEHHEIHEGAHFIASHVFSLGSGASLDFLVEQGAGGSAHFNFEVVFSQDTSIFLYENTAKTVGTLITNVCNSRVIATAPPLPISHTPGAGADGSLLFSVRYGASGISRAAPLRQQREFILGQSTKYLLHATSNAASNQLTAVFTYYVL
jgi:hypothetical protein